MERTFDRIPYFDARSKQYPAVDREKEYPLRSYTWRCEVWNDQGQEGACVGFAWSHELSARPAVYPVGHDIAYQIYYRAQEVDYWPGEEYEGTSVLAGVQAVQEMLNEEGDILIEEYRWAFGIEDLIKVLGYKGPAVLGLWWYSNMFYPDENNFIHASGMRMGGHALLAKGVKCVWLDKDAPREFYNLDIDNSYIKLHNSWGRDWGVDGGCFISVRDMDKLLQDDGEACIPVIRNK